jgi:hypothetical protein
MAKSKKKEKQPKKPSVKIEDLTPDTNPVGGSKIELEYLPPKPTPVPIDWRYSIK